MGKFGAVLVVVGLAIVVVIGIGHSNTHATVVGGAIAAIGLTMLFVHHTLRSRMR